MVAQELMIGTYNFRYKNNSDSIEGHIWSRRCRAMCDMIKWERPDLFGTQECLNQQILDLAGYLQDYKWIGVGRSNGKTSGEYSAIFYRPDRVTLLEQGTFWLSETPDEPSTGWDAAMNRICTWGKFRDKRTNRTFFLFNLHMDHKGDIARRHSVRMLLERIREKTNNGKILGISTADYNLDQKSNIYQLMATSGLVKDCYTSARRKFAPNGTTNGHFNPNSYTENRIDHIFVTQATEVETYSILTGLCWNHKEGDESAADCMSDHYPVFARIRFGNTVPTSESDDVLHIGDTIARNICLQQFDSNGDGVLTYGEAAAVTSVGQAFTASAIRLFPEFAFFTGLKDLSANTFAGCKQLTRLTLPDNITSIGNNAFSDCPKLKELTMPASIKAAGDNLFEGCKALTTVYIPAKSHSLFLSSYPWNETGKLEELDYTTTLPKNNSRWVLDNLITIAANNKIDVKREQAVLNNAESSEALIIAAQQSLRKQLRYVHFADKTTRDLALVHWDDDVDDELSYDEAAAIMDVGTIFKGATMQVMNMLSYTSVTSLSESAFQGCVKLTSIGLPDGLKTVNALAFSGCSKLSSITLPAGITSLGNSAFSQCRALKEVTCLQPNPSAISLGANVFYNVPVASATLYVPAGSEELYRKAAVWKDFGNIQPILANNTYLKRLKALLTLANLKGIEADAERATANNAQATLREIWEAVSSLSRKLEVITFDSEKTQELCLGQWDANLDGELTYAEAAAVTDISSVFRSSAITTFDELRFFTGLTAIPSQAFRQCSSLISVHLPATATSMGNFSFSSCSKLRYMVLPNDTLLMPYTAGAGLSKNITFFVPQSMLSSYRQHEQWSAYRFEPYTGEPIITADYQERLPGKNNPTLTFSVKGAPVNGTPELTCAADANSPEGDYPITIAAGSITTPNALFVDGILRVTNTLPVHVAKTDVSSETIYDIAGRKVTPSETPQHQGYPSLKSGFYISNHQKLFIR